MISVEESLPFNPLLVTKPRKLKTSETIITRIGIIWSLFVLNVGIITSMVTPIMKNIIRIMNTTAGMYVVLKASCGQLMNRFFISLIFFTHFVNYWIQVFTALYGTITIKVDHKIILFINILNENIVITRSKQFRNTGSVINTKLQFFNE